MQFLEEIIELVKGITREKYQFNAIKIRKYNVTQYNTQYTQQKMEDETRALFIQQRLNLLSTDRRQHRKPKNKKDARHTVKKGDGVKVRSCELTKLAEVVKANNSQHTETRKRTMVTSESKSDTAKRSPNMIGSGDSNEIPSQNQSIASKIAKSSKGCCKVQKSTKKHDCEPFERRTLVGGNVKTDKCPRVFVTSQSGEISLRNFDSNQENVVAKELVNRLKTENLLNTTKLANRKKIHDPKSCKKCIETEEKFAQYEFLKRRITRVESLNLDWKIDDVIHTTDTIFMIGDLAATLPKPSDDPKDIWDKLLRK